jgi:hypothetical protein
MTTRNRRCAWGALAAVTMLPWTSAPAAAANLATDDLLGRWCGAAADYTFTRTQLTVRHHDGSPDVVVNIARQELNNGSIIVTWVGGVGQTEFWHFALDRRGMYQRASEKGDLPEREFPRC